jgi:TfoX/Sxy family transcriptional regulator of competence genes
MAYDEALAQKVRRALASAKGLQEKKMFGGIAFLIDGTMCVGVDKNDLIVRCEKEDTDKLLAQPGARVFDLSGGRPMKGWLLVGPEGTRTAAGFKSWVDLAMQSSANGKNARPKRPGKRATTKK